MDAPNLFNKVIMEIIVVDISYLWVCSRPLQSRWLLHSGSPPRGSLDVMLGLYIPLQSEAKTREHLHLHIETSQTKHVVMKSGGGVFVLIIL